MKARFPFNIRELLFASFIPFLYAVVAFATIGHYGVGFDEPAHFRRGQAYVQFFLTGRKDYSNLPKDYRRSIYQSDNEGGIFYIDTPKNQSHPPLNDTLAALGNYIFFQKLGIVDDIDAHHIFSIATVTILLFAVYAFTRINFGVFAGLVAAISVALYPMFLGESHFNVKDPPEASFFTLTLLLFWYAVVKKNWKALIASAIGFGFAFGTKFNIIFLPFIIVPWIFFVRKQFFQQSKHWYVALILYPAIVAIIFFISNPNLWHDTLFRLSEMIRFYLSVGTKEGSPDYQPQFLVYRFNTYPFWAIIYSTPLVTLYFAIIGIAYGIKHFSDKHHVYGLLLLWLIVPILRVTLPNTTIYGGIRHIFEFVPALAILAGIGAQNIASRFQKKYIPFVFLCMIASYVPITLKLIALHPNENVYFNPLIGGLKGAVEKHFPNSGATLGNTYLQGVNWLNTHAEKGACIATPIAHRGNVPETKLRRDIRYDSTCQSNVERRGEYAMDMVYRDYFNEWYAYKYYDAYLYPVYEVKVEGVPVFAVFKNDKEHSKKELLTVAPIAPTSVVWERKVLMITLPQSVLLSSMLLSYDVPRSCKPVGDGYLSLSTDGANWKEEPDAISVSHSKSNYNPEDKIIERKFAAKYAKYIRIVTDIDNQCLLDIEKLSIYYHPHTADSPAQNPQR